MQYIQGIRDFSLDRPSAVTLGKFDGVHMGHQKLIEMIQEKAKQENLLSVVFTFDKIPLRLCPQKTSILLQPIQNGGCFWKNRVSMWKLNIRSQKIL